MSTPLYSGDDRARLAQQQLTNRLYRSHGQGLNVASAAAAKQANISGAGPRGARAIAAASNGTTITNAAASKQSNVLCHDPRALAQSSGGILALNPASAAASASPSSTSLPRSSSPKRSRNKLLGEESKEESKDATPVSSAGAGSGTFVVAPTRRARTYATQPDPSTVEVTHPLDKLLGDKLSLRAPVVGAVAAPLPGTSSASSDAAAAAAYSRTGQLPRSRAALLALRSRQGTGEGKEPSDEHEVRRSTMPSSSSTSLTSSSSASATPSALSSSMVARSSPTGPAGDAAAQYEAYLQSPFSFIDKALESPYTEEFVYLNARGPYDLVIVKHDKIDPHNYYTMSRAGVTHFYQQETDFTALDQWEREYFLFTKMMSIPFFKRFRMWKAFYFWKKYIRKTKHRKHARFLQENLYILNPVLRPSLLQLKNLCYNASKWTLFKVDPKHTLTLQQFQNNQEAQKNLVMDNLHKLMSEVRRIVSEACEVDLKQFLVQNGFRQGGAGGNGSQGSNVAGSTQGRKLDGVVGSTSQFEDEFGFGSTSMNMNGAGATGGVNGGFGEDSHPQKISHAERAANRTKCRKLTKYIRLADYFVIDTLVSLSMERTKDVLNFIERKPSSHQPLQKGAGKSASAAAANATNTSTATTTSGASAMKNVLGSPKAGVGASTTSGVSGSSSKKEDEDLPLFQVELELENQSALAACLQDSIREAPNAIVTAAARAATRNSDADEFHSTPLTTLLVPPTSGLLFNPSLEQWQSVLDASIDSAIRKIMTPKRLIHDPDFWAYTKANVGGGGAGGAGATGGDAGEDGDDTADFKLESMVLEDPLFLDIKSGIKSGLALAFQAAGLYAKSFEPARDTYLDNLSTDIAAFADAPIVVFKDLMAKYDTQIKELSKMAVSANVGIIQVDSSRLKNLFVPSPKARLSEIERLMPAVAREKCRELLEKCRESSTKISQIPATVDEFVEIMSFLNSIHEQSEVDHANFVFLQDLYNLLSEAKIRVPESDKAQFEKLTQTRQTFKTAIVLSESGIHSNTERFSKELESEIPVLLDDIKVTMEQLKDESLSQVDSDMDEVITFLEERDAQLCVLEEKAARFRHYQEVLQVEVGSWEELKETRQDLDVKLQLWSSLKTWNEFTTGWMNAPFEQIEIEEISKQVAIYNKVYARAKRALEGNPVVGLLREKIAAFQNTLPVVSDLRNPDLQKHHWDAIQKLLNHDVRNDPNFTLGTLITLNAMEHKQEIAIISNKAAQEMQLQQLLNKVIQTWSELNFPIVQHKDSKDVYILGNLDDILATLDDTMVTLNTIMSSRFVEPIKELVDEWNHKLQLFQETLDEWANCQRQWLYLEQIFLSQDIVRQLPDEFSLFSKVDRAWKEIMRRTNDQPNCILAGTYPGLRDNFHNYNAILDRVQKQLESYLETRRQQFPRFYFISNDELLRILANSKSVSNVQPHLRKLFEAIYALEFHEKDIKAMLSPEGERVPLGQNLKARGSAEVWLPALETDMVKTLRKFQKRGVTDYERMPRREWVMEKFAQVVCTVDQIAWTRGCEQAISDKNPRMAMNRWYEAQLLQLSELTSMVRGQLSPPDRKKIVALITQDVHGRDVVAALREQCVAELNNFTWQQQLRFYWDTDEDDVVIRQSNAKFLYGHEYMGVMSRLVITPLTDRCWMTITGALHIRFGAAPAGPAGTGKTESTKDLAKALGIFCVVFNCSEQINYKTMAKLFSGLAQAGAWTCLDEFNRIDIEVLSVIAQQLLQVRQALLVNAQDFNFQGQQIKLKQTFGCMITMNPGYAGRTELPDNLKVLFRPVSMMIPDYALIAEIMLFAEGFDNASALSTKMVKLYQLASEQLSQQDHYDWGMRAIKSILVMAGALKRTEPDLDEDIVLVRAMRNSNVPKFLAEDLPLFAALIQDLFPGLDIPDTDVGELDTAIRHAIQLTGLQPVEGFVQKVVQLSDTFNVRFGVMIVGPAGCGKSCIHDVLAKAMTALKEAGSTNENAQRVHTHTLNPKCISMDELYGSLSPMTGEWTDGLGSTIMREAMKDTSSERHWVVFDGPVDALWIENMNTVLDDNMTLCLVNGERIKLKQEMRMLFEVQDLSVASPATVSRCGMVYVSETNVGYLPFVRSWLPKFEGLAPQLENHLLKLFEEKLPLGIQFLRENCKEPIPTVDVQCTASLCALFEALFSVENGIDVTDTNLSNEDMKILIELLFAYSFAWGLGGSLDTESQRAFGKFCMEQFVNVRPPVSFFDSYVDVKERTWKSWESLVPSFEFDAKQSYFNMIVPTVDTVRYQSLLETLLGVEKAVFFTGTSGVGKTIIILDMFHGGNSAVNISQANNEARKRFSPLALTFSAQTSARKTQETIEGKLVKYRKTLLGAPANKQVIIFVDDVNMPATEIFGAQPPIELLRQFQDYKGFYDREKLFWKSIADTTLVCAAAPPGGGRHPLTPRFTRHFNILNLPQPSDAILKRIFGSIVGGFLNQFKPAVSKVKDALVNATVELYESITKELLPTPAKSHYTFNLRDISAVFRGILMLKPVSCSTAETMTRLWIHESQRCFQDRLISDEDRSWFTHKTTQLVQKQFGFHQWTHEELFEQEEPIMFGDWYRPGAERLYEEHPKGRSIGQLLDEYLDEYNMSSSNKMNLVFFQQAIDHISRIARILRQPRGHAMLVGVGGSGKQSLTRLACFMCEMKCTELEITRGFSFSDFQEHLKNIMISAGVAGKETVFLFTENQILDESFLEAVNNILNSGEVPNLFPPDEMTKILDDLTPVVRDMGLPASRTVVYNQFVSRVRERLHIVLCMSPIGEQFRTRLRQFPSLVNCTTIDWFTKWPRSALHSVAQRFLKDVSLPSEEVRSALVDLCVEFQESMEEACERFFGELRRRVYTTPKSYLDGIHFFLAMLAERRQQLGTQRQHLLTGLSKLIETKSVVAELKEQLTALKPTLLQKSKETEELLAQVSVDNEKADKVKAVVEAEEQEVATRTEEVREVQADAQADLDLALPALRSAIKALEKLKKAEISEVKSMANPPTGVVRTMEAVCVLLGVQADWENSKKLLSKVDFLKILKEYDKDNVDPRVIRRLQKYVQDPELTEERMATVSRAAASILSWVNAMVDYSAVAKAVAPKRARVEQMNALLAEANEKLAVKRKELQDVVERVAELKHKCEVTLAEKQSLDARTSQTEKRLERAQKLTTGLASEEIRWAKDAEEIGQKLVEIVGNAFISAACISYYGPFTGHYRQALVTNWHKSCLERGIPTSQSFTLADTLGNPVEIRQWNINGLPTDSVSIDSGLLVKKAFRWPLCIDPQEQAKKWIKLEHRSKLVVAKMNQRDLLKTVENAVRQGHALLIEDIGESVDASIDPILLKQIYIKGDQKYVKLGETEVEYNDKFRLYLTTKMSNPMYLPETQNKIALINFFVTRSGLEDQLLGDVVKAEAAEVEEKRNKSIAAMAKDRKSLDEIEDRILLLLSESKGNILDDSSLIDTLEESKFTSTLIEGRMQDTRATQEMVAATREKYRSVAQRGSILYFAVADLALIDNMYQYSLASFLRLFNLCIEQAAKSDDLQTRLDNLITHLTHSIFLNVSRGLFEVHKLQFSFMMCAAIQKEQGDINELEWTLLLRDGSSSVDKKRMQAIMDDMQINPAPEQIDAFSWKYLHMLDALLPSCKGLVSDISLGFSRWKEFMSSASPQTSSLPGAWDSKLSPFHRLLLLKALRFEKLLFGFSEYVSKKMGAFFVSNPQTSLEDVYKDTDRATPVIFVLSQGADPTGLLLRFARERKYEEKLHVISLGQGQGENAARMIEQARQRGEWVCLQNCHLSKSWMPALEEIVESFSTDDSSLSKGNDPNFRLWLTSMPCDYFPVSVLQKGVKLTNAPPSGLRANLLRSYQNVINADEFESMSYVAPTKSHAFKKLLYGLTFFHAVVQERKKFGPLGWNKSYEFNDSDLECSVQVLRMFLEEQESVPWDALRYVVGHINYGGRVTDDLDRRCLMAILHQYFTPDILDDAYTFSPSGLYRAPLTGALSTYIESIESLPVDADPEVFGMHENASLTFQRNASNAIVQSMLSIQPREIVSASGVSSDTIVASMAADMEEKMPPMLERRKAGPDTFVVHPNGVMDSLGTVLLQEMERFNRLLSTMRRTLIELQRAIKGEVVMSQELDLMYSSLLNNQVPQLWAKVAYPSLKPLASWVNDLHARIGFMQDWLVNGPPNSFWLSGFFFPQGFMTGALQNHARKYQIPIDSLSFHFTVLDVYERKEVDRAPEDGVLIDGLYMDGARWDDEERVVADSRLGELTARVPIIHFCPTDQPQVTQPDEYACPVYKTSVRAGVLSTSGKSTNYVLSVNLPIKHDESYWVLKGAALLCHDPAESGLVMPVA